MDKAIRMRVLLLELGLPHKSGLEILTALRGAGNTLPVLILTARDAIADPLLTHGDLTVHPATHQVTWRGQEVSLSGREFTLLQAWLERPGIVLSRAQFEERLYGWDDEIASNAVERLLTIAVCYREGHQTIRKSQTHRFTMRLNAERIV
jgi:two-component system response regulator QseB